MKAKPQATIELMKERVDKKRKKHPDDLVTKDVLFWYYFRRL